jgi:hypothetical protein
MAIKNTKLGGTDWDTPSARVKPTDLNDTFDSVIIGVDTTTTITYTGDNVTEIEETKNGEVWTTTITYDGDEVDYIETSVNGKTIKSDFTYTDGNVTSIVKTITD